MRKSHLALAGLGLTAAAVTGSAMTAENTIDDTIAGYGESAITGAVVTEIDYLPLAADSTYLDEVVFTTTTQLDLTPSTGNSATLTLKDGGAPMGTPIACTIAAWSGTSHTITCDTPDTTQFILVDAVGLTVGD
jgi:hypothetical protein